MDFKKIVFLSVFISSIIAISYVAFAEEAPITNTNSATITPSQQSAVTQEKNDTQWAWGEVINLDNQAKTLTIKYLDYETDQEKELVLAVDDKTTFENIKGLDEIKIKDTLSIDYTTGPDNKSIAKNINLEKPDALPSVPVQTNEEVKPAALTTPATSSSEAATPETASTPVLTPTPAVESAPSTTTEPAAPAAESAPEVQGQAQ